MTGTAIHSPPTQASRGSSINNIRIDLGGATLAVIVTLVAIIGACGVVMGFDMADRDAFAREEQQRDARLGEEMQNLQRQYRMTELKLDDWTVVAHRAGLQLPGDYTRGPQGNPDAQSFNIKPKGK